MPIPKKLTCKDIEIIFTEFIEGTTVKALAERFGVTRLTVTRALRGETYQDCVDKFLDNKEEFFTNVDDLMKANQRRSRGQGKRVG